MVGPPLGRLSAELMEAWPVRLWGRWRFTVMILVVAGAALTTPTVLAAGGTPTASPQVICCSGASGFWLGTDSGAPIAGGSAPYLEPNVDATYGVYVGEIGGWWDMPGLTNCQAHNYYQSANINAANVNLASYGYGVGAGAYWFMGGPGLDPNYGTYGGSAKEAWTWGVLQAQTALSRYNSTQFSPGFNLPILFMDIEGHEDSGATTHGWNAVAVPGECDTKDGNGIAYTVDRCTFNGFWDWLENGSSATPGSLCDSGGSQSINVTSTASPEVTCCGPGEHPAPGAYSSPGYWTYTFGDQGSISTTWEWTSEDAAGAYSDSNDNVPAPTVPDGAWKYDFNSPPEQGTGELCNGESSSEGCSYTADADFFGGQSAGGVHALMWQWDVIPSGDYDTVLKSILPSGW